MSFGPQAAAQRGEIYSPKQTVPVVVGPEFAGISNSTELGHGLGSPAAAPLVLLAPGRVAKASIGGGASKMGLNYSTESGFILGKKIPPKNIIFFNASDRL